MAEGGLIVLNGDAGDFLFINSNFNPPVQTRFIKGIDSVTRLKDAMMLEDSAVLRQWLSQGDILEGVIDADTAETAFTNYFVNQATLTCDGFGEAPFVWEAVDDVLLEEALEAAAEVIELALAALVALRK